MIINLKKVLTLFLTLIFTLNLVIASFAAEDDFPDPFAEYGPCFPFAAEDSAEEKFKKFYYYVDNDGLYYLENENKELLNTFSSYCTLYDEVERLAPLGNFDLVLIPNPYDLFFGVEEYNSGNGSSYSTATEKNQEVCTVEQIFPASLSDSSISQIFDEDTTEPQELEPPSKKAFLVADAPAEQMDNLDSFVEDTTELILATDAPTETMTLSLNESNKLYFLALYNLALYNKLVGTPGAFRKEIYPSDYTIVLKYILNQASEGDFSSWNIYGRNCINAIKALIRDNNLRTPIVPVNLAKFQELYEEVKVNLTGRARCMEIHDDDENYLFAENLFYMACGWSSCQKRTPKKVYENCKLLKDMLKIISEGCWQNTKIGGQ